MRNPYKSATARGIRLQAKTLHPDANKHDPDAAKVITATHKTHGGEAKGRAFGGGETFHRDAFDTECNAMPKEIATAISGATLSVTVLLVALAMLIVSPLITRSLIPLTFANNDGGDRNSSPVGPNEKGVLAAKLHRDPSVPSGPRLVWEQSPSYVAGDSIALGIGVDGKADGMALEISDLPGGTTISSGRPLGTGVWRILATDVSNALIHLPPGLSGPIDLSLELRLVDDTVVDHRSLHLEWPQRPTQTLEPISSADTMVVSVGAKARSQSFVDKDAVTGTPMDRVAVLDAIVGDHDPIELLIGRSEKLLSEGQVEAARLLLLPGAEARHARAALALGATYDPIMLAIVRARGVAADVSVALDWYRKASEFGSQKAQQQLNLLTAASLHSKNTGGVAASDNAVPKVMASSPLARPKGHVARAPTHQRRPHDHYGVDVAGAGTGPDPLLSPAFIP